MSADAELFENAVKGLAAVITPDTRVVVVLSAEANQHDDTVRIRMRVFEDCRVTQTELAAILTKAAGMALDPRAKREPEPQARA